MLTDKSTESQLFDRVVQLLDEMVGDVDILGIEITRETTFHEDLQLESIDLVTFAGILGEEFGDRVNLAEYLAEKELDEVIELKVGDILDYLVSRLEGVSVGEG